MKPSSDIALFTTTLQVLTSLMRFSTDLGKPEAES
jgi:hypothetical protein